MSSKSSGKGSTTPTLPGWLSSALSSNLESMGGMPGIESFFQNYPMLGTNPNQLGDIAYMQNLGWKGPQAWSDPAMQASEKGLEQFIGGGPGKPSAATLAGKQEFADLQAPGIQNWASSMGLGNSGAAIDALAQGQEQAMVPLLEQDQANQLAAAGQLGQLGGMEEQLGLGKFGAQMGGLQAAEQAQGIPEQNLFNKQMGQEMLGMNIRNELMGLLGNLFGNKSSQSGSSMDPMGFLSMLFG